MECNKDEAIRAKEQAEKKLLEMDFKGAEYFVLRAQDLFPELDGLSQFLEVIQLFVASERDFMGERNWYKILGVDPRAATDVIKTQYKRLALKFHPDKNKSIGAEGAFKLVGEAWSILSDMNKRLEYDSRLIFTAPGMVVYTENPQTQNPQTPVYDFFNHTGSSNQSNAPNMHARPTNAEATTNFGYNFGAQSSMPDTTNQPTPSRGTFIFGVNFGSSSSRPNPTNQPTPSRGTFPSTTTESQNVPPPTPSRSPSSNPPTSSNRPSAVRTFWTKCESCSWNFKLHMKFLRKKHCCPRCLEPFITRARTPREDITRNARPWI